MSTNRNLQRPTKAGVDHARLDEVVKKARQDREERLKGYREQSLRLHPPICARCGREFTKENMRELTVHHKDHNHDNNPTDGSNWENLCLYCHDHEHQKYEHFVRGIELEAVKLNTATFSPFANLQELLKKQPRP